MNLSSLVGHVVELYEQIDKNTRPADNLTTDFLRSKKYLGPKDRRYISDSVFGMLRNKRLIETLLNRYVHENQTAQELVAPQLRYIPWCIVFQLITDGTQADKIVAPLYSFWENYFPNIDLATFVQWISSHKGFDYSGGNEIVRLGTKHSFQDWMVTEWKEQFGKETESLLKTLNTNGSIALRVNLLKTDQENCQRRLRKKGIEAKPTMLSPVGLIANKKFNKLALDIFKDGWFEIQDEGSQIISLIASPRSRDLVIDACAGTGGKTLHLAEQMNDYGEIIAIDIDQRRLDELVLRTKRAGVHCVRTIKREELIPEEFFEKADIVLIDAPCSGTGTIRRNPGLKWSVTQELVQRNSELQKMLLESNAQFVKKGGKLIYATCSIMRDENENVVNSFLAQQQNFILETLIGSFIPPSSLTSEGFVKLLPHKHRTDGYFIAAMKKVG
jgi:16S rRNA (cytosine967-C5)-methyltransferase